MSHSWRTCLDAFKQELKNAILEDIIRLGKEAGLKSFEQVKYSNKHNSYNANVPGVLCFYYVLINYVFFAFIGICVFRWETLLCTQRCFLFRMDFSHQHWKPRELSWGDTSGIRSTSSTPKSKCKWKITPLTLKARDIPWTLLNLHTCWRMGTGLFITKTVDVLLDSMKSKL